MSSDTIEPALLARFFHDDIYDLSIESFFSSSGQLPPLRDVVGHDVPTRRTDTSKHNELTTSTSQFSSQNSSLINPSSSQENVHQSIGTRPVHGSSTNRALGDSSPQSLRKILGKDTDTPVGSSSKKRRNAEPAKDDFVQLPQPPKKQKTATQIVPPIISGLHDIPQAKIPYKFPRIESGAFHDSNGRNSLNTGPPPTILPAPQNEAAVGIVVTSIELQEPARQPVKRTRKVYGQRRRWGKEETEWVIQGAHRHGVGNWVEVLNDPEFAFVNRKPGDLKDRFRTVCPTGVLKDLKHRSQSPTIPTQERTVSKSPKFRGHRKGVDDLAKLGIETPFKKSERRERRPFTEEEDREILRAYRIYANQWARISRDEEFHFLERTSTDLRDRYRNILKSKERSPPLPSNKSLGKAHSNEALASGQPSSSGQFTPAQDASALQSSTLNSGEPRIADPLSRHPSSSDLHSQSQGILKVMEPWTKEMNQDIRNKDGHSSTETSFQAQASTNKISEPWMKEANHNPPNNRSKHEQPAIYHHDLDLRSTTLNKPDDSWPKEHQAQVTPTTATHQTSGLRIQEIISTSQESSHNNLFAYTDHALEPSYTQSFDWPSNLPITAPHSQTLTHDMDISRLTHGESSYGEMDVQRILQSDWQNDIAETTVHGLNGNGKGKPSFTNIESILSRNDEPVMAMTSQPSSFFTNMLNSDEPLGLDDQPVWPRF